jgi:hypothetical protein
MRDPLFININITLWFWRITITVMIGQGINDVETSGSVTTESAYSLL